MTDVVNGSFFGTLACRERGSNDYHWKHLQLSERFMSKWLLKINVSFCSCLKLGCNTLDLVYKYSLGWGGGG